MLDKAFAQVSKPDISALVDNEVKESRTLEYKERLPGNTDDDKKEFLADVSSLANASGGHLLFGVKEKRDEDGRATGRPEVAHGLAKINTDLEIGRLENILRDGLDPRVPGVRFREIAGFPKGPVIIAHVPKSWSAPHMVTYKGASRFHWMRMRRHSSSVRKARNENSEVPMTISNAYSSMTLFPRVVLTRSSLRRSRN